MGPVQTRDVSWDLKEFYFLQALHFFIYHSLIYYRRPRLLRYVEVIFPSVCTSLCVCSFSAILVQITLVCKTDW